MEEESDTRQTHIKDNTYSISALLIFDQSLLYLIVQNAERHLEIRTSASEKEMSFNLEQRAFECRAP